MGCSSSSAKDAVTDGEPAATDQHQPGPPPADAPQPKKGNGRARRLSHVSPGVAAGPIPGQEPSSVGPRAPSQKSDGTRKRRLSYVPFKDGDPAKGMETAAQDLGAMQSPDVDQPAYMPPTNATIIQNIGCISVTGLEDGYKKVNQDKVCVLAQFMDPEQSFFAALDGHGPSGHLVADFIARNLSIVLGEYLARYPLSKALLDAFVKVDDGLKNSAIDCSFSGAATTISVLKGSVLTTAWVGDSRGVLGRRVGGAIQAFDLTQDHKPSQPEEEARIIAAGGRVERLQMEDGEFIGPPRVWVKDAWLPGLAMSRALGDAIAHSVGVSNKPDISEVMLTSDDAFVILASDGIWEFIESQEAVNIVAECADAPTACETLSQLASARWVEAEDGISDDISCVIIFFK